MERPSYTCLRSCYGGVPPRGSRKTKSQVQALEAWTSLFNVHLKTCFLAFMLDKHDVLEHVIRSWQLHKPLHGGFTEDVSTSVFWKQAIRAQLRQVSKNLA